MLWWLGYNYLFSLPNHSINSKLIMTYTPPHQHTRRRNRRMTEMYYQRILKTQYIRLVSKYGVVYLDEYPAPKAAEDLLLEKDGLEPLTDRESFVSVFLPQFTNIGTHRYVCVCVCV